MTGTYVVEQLGEEHLQALTALEAETFSDPWSAEGIRPTINGADRYTALGILENDELAAYAFVQCLYDEAELLRIAVAPAFKRKGLGSLLLGKSISLCRESGMTRLLLEVREGNLPARALYEKYGFRVDAVRKNYYTNPTEHAVLMSLPL